MVTDLNVPLLGMGASGYLGPLAARVQNLVPDGQGGLVSRPSTFAVTPSGLLSTGTAVIDVVAAPHVDGATQYSALVGNPLGALEWKRVSHVQLNLYGPEDFVPPSHANTGGGLAQFCRCVWGELSGQPSVVYPETNLRLRQFSASTWGGLLTVPFNPDALAAWSGRLVIAAGDRVHFSDASGTFGATDWVDVDPNDGETIVGMATYAGDLYVFKQTKFFVFWGISTDSGGNPVFEYRTVVGVGIPTGEDTFIGGRTRGPQVAALGRGVYFAGPEGRVWVTQGGLASRLSPECPVRSVDTLVAHDGVLYCSKPLPSIYSQPTDLLGAACVFHEAEDLWSYYSPPTRNDGFITFEPVGPGVLFPLLGLASEAPGLGWMGTEYNRAEIVGADLDNTPSVHGVRDLGGPLAPSRYASQPVLVGESVCAYVAAQYQTCQTDGTNAIYSLRTAGTTERLGPTFGPPTLSLNENAQLLKARGARGQRHWIEFWSTGGTRLVGLSMRLRGTPMAGFSPDRGQR